MPTRAAERSSGEVMSGLLDTVAAVLRTAPGTNRHLVALSGGADSTALLLLMAQLRRRERGLTVRAVHVHHGLQRDADAWTDHCKRLCAHLGVPLEICYATGLRAASGESPEAAARHARYRLLARTMQPGDALLTGHHVQDQLETVLMRLIKGGGVEGLAGIPVVRPFGPGRLVRPLLGCSRDTLKGIVRDHDLTWLSDPSNEDCRFDRNYLRTKLLPPLLERWPSAADSVARTAAHMVAASELLEDVALADLAAAKDGEPGLGLAAFRQLSPARQRNLLRGWIRQAGFRVPGTRRLDALIAAMILAREDGAPRVHWDGVEIRRYRDRLYLMKSLQPVPADWTADWSLAGPLGLPAGLGRLEASGTGRGGIDARLLEGRPLSVRFRLGGEKMRPEGARHHRGLSKLFQERGIPPWVRNRTPLLWDRDRLVAVADMWVAEAYLNTGAAQGLGIRWEGRPRF